MKNLFQKSFYKLLLGFALIYTIYTIYHNLFADAQAADFLMHKNGPNQPPSILLWLNMMYVHVVAACLAMLSGAVNFWNARSSRPRRWHRSNGYLYAAAVLVVDLTSGFMAPYATGGKLTSIPFNLVNIVWLWFTIAAIVQIKKGNVFQHRRWMVRSYVFCFTNIFIHSIEWIAVKGIGIDDQTAYIVGVYGAIMVNVLIAEIINRVWWRQLPDRYSSHSNVG